VSNNELQLDKNYTYAYAFQNISLSFI